MSAARNAPWWRDVDEALVRTALADAPEATKAWAQLPADFQLDDLVAGDRTRLLPVIGRNLGGSGSHPADLERFADASRRNVETHEDEALRVASLLDALGDIPVWLNGGVAIARARWGYDGDLSTRWADDTRAIWWRPSRFVVAGGWDVEADEIDIAGRRALTLGPERTLVQVSVDAQLDWRRFGISWLLDVYRLLDADQVDRPAAQAIADRSDVGEVFRSSLASAALVRLGAGSLDWLDTAPIDPGSGDRLRSDFEAFGHGLTTPGLMRGLHEFLVDRRSPEAI